LIGSGLPAGCSVSTLPNPKTEILCHAQSFSLVDLSIILALAIVAVFGYKYCRCCV
jgi:hypothetical protein